MGISEMSDDPPLSPPEEELSELESTAMDREIVTGEQLTTLYSLIKREVTDIAAEYDQPIGDTPRQAYFMVLESLLRWDDEGINRPIGGLLDELETGGTQARGNITFALGQASVRFQDAARITDAALQEKYS